MTKDIVLVGASLTHDWTNLTGPGLASCTKCPTKASHNSLRRGMVPVCSPEVHCTLGWHEIVLDPDQGLHASCMFCDEVFRPTGAEGGVSS